MTKIAPINTRTPIWDWFSLSRASYLVLPRLGMQAMPIEWQNRMISLLDELIEAGMAPHGKYRVSRINNRGRFVPDPWRDYRRGSADEAREAEKEATK